MSDGATPDARPPKGPRVAEMGRIVTRMIASLFRKTTPPLSPSRPTPEGLADPEDPFPGPTIVSDDTRREVRIPPRQVRTRKWPVLHAGPTPVVDLATWTLVVDGLVDRPSRWTWDEFRALPPIRVEADMHCVTRWSRLDNTWEGVGTAELGRIVGPKPDASYVVLHCEQGFTTNLPVGVFFGDDCLLAWGNDGRPLDADHGAPLRVVVPQRYAWKSAKWIRRIEFVAFDRPGYWERLGYHNEGDPWLQQRFV